MLPKSKFKLKKSTSDAPVINPRVILLLLVVVSCGVFLWAYYNTSARNVQADSPDNQKMIITRPVEINQQ